MLIKESSMKSSEGLSSGSSHLLDYLVKAASFVWALENQPRCLFCGADFAMPLCFVTQVFYGAASPEPASARSVLCL